MTKGFYSIMLAQFLSSLADNALLIAAIALLTTLNEPAWMTPLLKLFFVVSYVIFAAWVGIFADSMPKGRVMFITNAVKTVGCIIMLFGTHPLLAYAIVGLGAAAYSPAKYGILTELLPPEKLVKANGWIEGLTVASIILGTGLGGLLISPMVDHFVQGHHVFGVHNAAQAAIAVMIFVYAAVPDRILQFTEMLVCDYLNQEMCDNRPPRGAFDLFATEGGTAAMCYIFDSLQENFLLDKGDGIALMVPAFTPYIEIPQLDRYRFKVTELHANRMSKDGLHLWQYSDEDIDRLKNPAIKALFVTNPSNPPSYTLSPETMARIVNIVKEDNPNLMIITDDVYGTFSPHFRSFMAEIPYNTLCVYSFSKYFGATGWRNAVIALHEYNVFDRQISRLPKEKREALNRRYATLTLHPEKLKFIDRMVADSRQIALNHTAGLSLPQQMQMSLFAAFALLDKENSYKQKMQEIIRRRLQALWDNTGFTLVEDPLRVGYYTEIDMLVWAE